VFACSASGGPKKLESGRDGLCNRSFHDDDDALTAKASSSNSNTSWLAFWITWSVSDRTEIYAGHQRMPKKRGVYIYLFISVYFFTHETRGPRPIPSMPTMDRPVGFLFPSPPGTQASPHLTSPAALSIDPRIKRLGALKWKKS
jgi:hypothetical protein